MSLRLRLMLLAAICVLPAALLLVVTQFQLRRERESEVRREIAEVARSEADHVAGIIQGASQLLSALALSPAIRDRNAPYCSALLSRLMREHAYYAAISADDADGRSFCTSEPGKATFEGDRGYFHTAVAQRGFVVGEYGTSPLSKGPVLPVAQAIIAPEGNLLGVLVLSLNLDEVMHGLAARLPAKTALTIVDRNMTVVLQIVDGTGPEGPAALTQFLLAPPSGQPTIADITDGADRAAIMARAPVGDGASGLQVVAARDRDIAFQSLSETTRDGAILIGVALALAVLTAAWVARRFVQRPIRELLGAADRLRDGDFGFRMTGTAGRSELARFGQGLNELAGVLEERERARVAAEGQLRELAATLEERVEQRTRELAEANARAAAETVERQRTEAELAQSQKLEAVGKLTGGVAHDFNNLLTAIMGTVELAMERVADANVKRLLAVAMQAAERGARLTRQMLAFSRKQDLTLQPVDINAAIIGMSDLLRRTIGAMVQIELDLADDLWLAMTDQVQLEVALLNLAVNAQDAMLEGGSLRLRSRNVTVVTTSQALPALQPGDYAMLTVSDTGHGMPAEVVANAFEPFFTTKEPSKGTGLGLSMVYGFARQAGGSATIESCVGKGTSVSIYLPRARALPDQKVQLLVSAAGSRPMRILLTDDDEGARVATKEMLADLGHDVVEAEDGPAALECLRTDGPFDLLIVDFAMPGMTGTDVAAQALDDVPDLAILFMTGYADSDRLRSWSERGYRTLSKPFHVAELAIALRQARDQHFRQAS
jgi:signal transduction histidine kinase/ActR/RegA family two-component response regulator